MRYIIGIDLGTTNCCVAYVDSKSSNKAIQSFRIPQLISERRVDSIETLPSFCYLVSPQEWAQNALKLPWKNCPEFFVGGFARDQGAKIPTRVIQSAKSWLCHSAANRRDRILPFEAGDDTQRISPVEASARYLMHIKEAWNYLIAQGNAEEEFEQQEIVLTVPASFDEVARALTVEAARMAGYQQVTLLEEPQAVFYSWIAQHEGFEELKENDTVLVCDIGGGTTDFSLIIAQKTNGDLTFQRMAVGDHLLLGGDNMDFAIAHWLEQRLREKGLPELDTNQWLQLLHEARDAKEALLSSKEIDAYQMVLKGSGSALIRGSVMLSIDKKELQEKLLEGFFGSYSWKEALNLRKRSGFRAMGLPYEEEPSITKHLANFLRGSGDDIARPDYVLFNGGAMKSEPFQEAILRSLERWFPEKSPKSLVISSLDTAVARGAAYYGKARRGWGVRIGGGIPRGYYLAVGERTSCKALTLLPRGSEEGASYEPDQLFFVTPNMPVVFYVYTSHVRLHDEKGSFVEINDEEMHLLPPIRTVLRYGKGKQNTREIEKIPVHLKISLTPIGTLDLCLKSLNTDHQWVMEFQLRNAEGLENNLSLLGKLGRTDEAFDSCYLEKAIQVIENIFVGMSSIQPEKMMELLEESLESSRRDWSPSVLRGLWPSLLKVGACRKLSVEHEARWWNLAGFLLRPGFGYPLDDFRLKELWKLILADMKSTKAFEVQIQNWICIRRIAGGLNKGQQIQLASEFVTSLLKKGKIEVKGKSDLYPYSEKLRALASLELIEMSIKIKIADAVLDRILAGKGISADYWALGRMGARHLVYGTVANVVSRDVCCAWLEKLMGIPENQYLILLFGQLARKTDHRELNIPESLASRIIEKCSILPNHDRLKRLLFEVSSLTHEETDQIIGDKLPLGIHLYT